MAQECHDCQVETGPKNYIPHFSSPSPHKQTDQAPLFDADPIVLKTSQMGGALETLGATKTVNGDETPIASKTLTGRSSYRVHRALRQTGLLPSKNAYICLKAGISSKEVRLIKTHKGHVSKKGLVSCGLLWQCSVCRQRILREKRTLLKQVTNRSNTNNVMVTLTMPHKKGDDLIQMMKTLRQGWNSFRNDRQFKHLQQRLGFQWGVCATEVTHGKNGFHPHLHILLGYLEDPSTALDEMKNLIQTLWTRVCRAFRNTSVITNSTVHSTSVTILENGEEEYVVKWSCVDEMTDSSQIKKGKNGNKSIAQMELEATEQYEKTGWIETGLYSTLKEYYQKMTGK